jgi:hypothetical protein
MELIKYSTVFKWIRSGFNEKWRRCTSLSAFLAIPMHFSFIWTPFSSYSSKSQCRRSLPHIYALRDHLGSAPFPVQFLPRVIDRLPSEIARPSLLKYLAFRRSIEKIEALGALLIGNPLPSHCLKRPRSPRMGPSLCISFTCKPNPPGIRILLNYLNSSVSFSFRKLGPGRKSDSVASKKSTRSHSRFANSMSRSGV